MKISCPHCGQHFNVPESYKGSTVTCTKCHNDFVVEEPAKYEEPIKHKENIAISPFTSQFKTPILASVFFAFGIILWIISVILIVFGFVMKTSPMILSGVGTLFAGLIHYGIGQVLSAISETAHNSKIIAENSINIVHLLKK